jgi:hypothetical protein
LFPVVGFGILGTLIGYSLPIASAADGATVVTERANLEDPNSTLQAAEQASPYEIVLPSFLPSDSQLVHAEWTDQEAAGSVLFGVDVWYELSDGAALHVWETNDPALAERGKDPVDPPNISGTSQQDNATWVLWKSEDPAYPMMAVAGRLEGGLTVSIDAPIGAMSESELYDVAGSVG